MNKLFFALMISLPVIASPAHKPLSGKELKAKQDALLCKRPNLTPQMKKAHGCK